MNSQLSFPTSQWQRQQSKYIISTQDQASCWIYFFSLFSFLSFKLGDNQGNGRNIRIAATTDNLLLYHKTFLTLRTAKRKLNNTSVTNFKLNNTSVDSFKRTMMYHLQIILCKWFATALLLQNLFFQKNEFFEISKFYKS